MGRAASDAHVGAVGLALNHPDRVPEGNPVQRAEVGIEHEYSVHRVRLLRIEADVERLPRVELGSSPWHGDALPLCYNRMRAVGQSRTGHLARTGRVLYLMGYDGVVLRVRLERTLCAV